MYSDAVYVVVQHSVNFGDAVLELCVVEYHSVFVEVVAPLRQQSVCLVGAYPEVTSVLRHVLYRLAVCAEVVVKIMSLCVLDLRQSLVEYGFAVLEPVGVLAVDAQSVLAYCLKLCRVLGVSRYFRHFGTPADELVAVIRSLRFFGCSLINGDRAEFICGGGLFSANIPCDIGSGLGYHRAAFQLFIAVFAVDVTAVTVLGKGRSDISSEFLGMPLGRDNFLCNKNLIADGAMLTFSLAAFCAGGRNSFVDYFRMPLSRNLFLRYKHFVADGAVFTLSLAGRGAGSCNSFVNRFGMTRSGDFLNSGDRCAAD